MAPWVRLNDCGVWSDTNLDDIGFNDDVYLLSFAPLWNKENTGFTSLGITFYPVVKVCRCPEETILQLLFVGRCIISVKAIIIVNAPSGFTAGGFLHQYLLHSDQEGCPSCRLLNLWECGIWQSKAWHTYRMSSEKAEFPFLGVGPQLAEQKSQQCLRPPSPS